MIINMSEHSPKTDEAGENDIIEIPIEFRYE